VTNQSCAATSSANTLIGVGCPHAPPSCANLHSARRSRRHYLPFPAGSFIEGFRTPATVQAASPRSAGFRNPQQVQTSSACPGMSVWCQQRTHALQQTATFSFVTSCLENYRARVNHPRPRFADTAHERKVGCPLNRIRARSWTVPSQHGRTIGFSFPGRRGCPQHRRGTRAKDAAFASKESDLKQGVRIFFDSGDSASILSIRPTMKEKREDVSIIFKGPC
jgi:hypothetical protein